MRDKRGNRCSYLGVKTCNRVCNGCFVSSHECVNAAVSTDIGDLYVNASCEHKITPILVFVPGGTSKTRQKESESKGLTLVKPHESNILIILY